MKLNIINDGVQVVPETEFEKQYLTNIFIGEQRKVIVKSGAGVGDLISLNITGGKQT